MIGDMLGVVIILGLPFGFQQQSHERNSTEGVRCNPLCNPVREDVGTKYYE